MTKRLVLIRHGKSNWEDVGVKDFDRTLNHQGNKNTYEMAQRMSQANLIPELIVSSPAIRSLTTAQHFSETWGIPERSIKQEPVIYEANVTTLLKVVNQLDNGYDIVALFGHNPGLTDFTNFLADAHIYNIPTAGIVIIDFPFDDWSMISQHTGNLFLFDWPKRIKSA